MDWENLKNTLQNLKKFKGRGVAEPFPHLTINGLTKVLV